MPLFYIHVPLFYMSLFYIHVPLFYICLCSIYMCLCSIYAFILVGQKFGAFWQEFILVVQLKCKVATAATIVQVSLQQFVVL